MFRFESKIGKASNCIDLLRVSLLPILSPAYAYQYYGVSFCYESNEIVLIPIIHRDCDNAFIERVFLLENVALMKGSDCPNLSTNLIRNVSESVLHSSYRDIGISLYQ